MHQRASQKKTVQNHRLDRQLKQKYGRSCNPGYNQTDFKDSVHFDTSTYNYSSIRSHLLRKCEEAR